MTSKEIIAQPLGKTKTPITLGFGAHVGYNVLGANYYFSFPDSIGACGLFNDGKGIRPSLNVFADIPLTTTFALHSSAGYQNLSGALESAPFDKAPGFVNQKLEAVPRVHRYEVSVAALSIHILGLWHGPAGIDIAGGPSFSVPISNSYKQTENITSNNFVYDQTGTQTRTLAEGKISSLSGFVAGAMVSFAYPLYMKGDMVLSPGILWSYPLTKLSADENLRVSTYALGVTIGWQLREKEPPPPPPPPPPPKVYALDASFDVYGVGEDGERIAVPPMTIEKTVIREEFNLLAKIFFDEGASAVPGRYRLFAGRTQAERFTIDSLIAKDALAINHDILNIIGYRLHNNPSIRIKLTGATSGTGSEATNSIELARSRAESVKAYLVNAWGITPERIAVEARKLPESPSPVGTPEGQAENRRVDISSDDYDGVKPLELTTIDYVVNPPRLGVEPKIYSDTTIASSEFTISTRSRTLIHITNDPSSQPEEAQVWRITPEMIGDDEDSLLVSLVVTDVLGHRIERHSSLRIARANKTTETNIAEKLQDRQVERFSLITFDFNKGTLPEEEQRKLESAVKTLTNSSTVTVSGYTDKTGDEARNAKLSRERAENVAALLEEGARKRGLTTQGITVDAQGAKDLYDNTLPEGRFLSRTVKIEIVKPLK